MKQSSVIREVGGKYVNSRFSPEIKAAAVLIKMRKTHEVCDRESIKYNISVSLFSCICNRDQKIDNNTRFSFTLCLNAFLMLIFPKLFQVF